MHLKALAETKYAGGSFLAYLDAIKRLANNCDMPKNALIMFVLNGLPINNASSLMMKNVWQIAWEKNYNACKGFDYTLGGNEYTSTIQWKYVKLKNHSDVDIVERRDIF